MPAPHPRGTRCARAGRGLSPLPAQHALLFGGPGETQEVPGTPREPQVKPDKPRRRIPLADTSTPALGVRAARERGEACRLSPRSMRCRLVVRGSPGRSQEPLGNPGALRQAQESPGQPRRAQEAQGSPRKPRGAQRNPQGPDSLESYIAGSQ